MIPEPESRGGQPRQGRNNNLLGLAMVLFMIGLGILQGAVPFLLYFFTSDAFTWTVLMLLGVVPTIGGIYVLWKWWQSGY
jgi:hypothetical protein